MRLFREDWRWCYMYCGGCVAWPCCAAVLDRPTSGARATWIASLQRRVWLLARVLGRRRQTLSDSVWRHVDRSGHRRVDRSSRTTITTGATAAPEPRAEPDDDADVVVVGVRTRADPEAAARAAAVAVDDDDDDGSADRQRNRELPAVIASKVLFNGCQRSNQDEL